MKLTYWISHCLVDSPCYSIRRRTRREVKQELEALGNPEGMTRPMKIVVSFDNALDLLNQALGEGGLSAESSSRSEALGGQQAQ